MNNTCIIDFHIHHYPEAVAKDPIAWATANKEAHWAQLMQSNKLQGWPSTQTLLQDMREAQVQRAVLQGWYWENLATCIEHNSWLAHLVQTYPHQFSGFASIQPLAGNAAIDALKKAHDEGLIGIGEMFPAAQGFAMDDSTWLKIVAWATEHRLPIMLHVPEPVGHHYAGKISAPLEDYQWLAENFPETIFIFAHWGGLLPFYELNEYCKKIFHNVYYDTAASPLLYDQDIYASVVDAIGSEKILFGSDYPLRTFPKRQQRPHFKHAINEVKTAGLTASDLDNILNKNALKLLGLAQTQ